MAFLLSSIALNFGFSIGSFLSGIFDMSWTMEGVERAARRVDGRVQVAVRGAKAPMEGTVLTKAYIVDVIERASEV
eukprot:CAMPEP_0174900314 /NCGR_PEP_ID=MMETSP0167-20121228/30690_1 /TAXON_ID=38298 /ORGANISM="Rhodella maculata, Strain CCMP736" /LENGTH=75 /DNA_ID=CAMNT_0016141637 /DNA_START=101 /DNA_END=328 /DNA_ORIENTATION=-